MTWTPARVNFIKENYNKISIREIAEKLNVSYIVANSKIQNMKKKGQLKGENKVKSKTGRKQKINWKKIEPYIINNYKTMTWEEMARRLKIKYTTLYNHAKRMRELGIIGTKECTQAPEPNDIKLQIAELDRNMELGRRYHIKKFGSRDKFTTLNFTGKLTQVTDRFYTFRNKNRAESFLKVDFAIGEYNIKELTK
jgi:transposase